MKLTALILCFVTCVARVNSQERSYTQYDVDKGLAGSTVYSIIQDKEGFIWLGTETGVSRFDGTHFKNFGVADGLPDVEILKLFQDSKGRIWMAPFKKAICYYYKGKIYNAQNDSLLRIIRQHGHLLNFAEDEKGNILILESDQLHLISENKLTTFNTFNGKPLGTCVAISESATGGFMVVTGNDVFELRDGKLQYLFSEKIPFQNFRYVVLDKHWLVWKSSPSENTILNLQNGERFNQPTGKQNTLQLIGDSLFVNNSQIGCQLLRLNGSRSIRNMLDGKPVSSVLLDNEGNYWFTTLGQGIYRLNSENMESIQLINRNGRKLGAYCIKVLPDKWLVCADMMNVFKITHHSPKASIELIWDEFGSEIPARATAIEEVNDKQFVLGTDMVLKSIPGPRTDPVQPKYVVKSIYSKSPDEILVAASSCVALVKIPNLISIDTLWKERSTTVYYRNDTVYVGTLDGLYLVAKNHSQIFAGATDTLLRNRINQITESSDGTLWIASNGVGVLAYRNGRVERQISIKDGLSSNICRAICVHDNELWIGTDKGLNRIVFEPGGIKITILTTGDGLASNMINSIGLDGDIVVVATSAGVNYFNKNRIILESKCNLVIDHILVSYRHLQPTSRGFSLAHKDNNIHFEFTGISFRSGGQMSYEYRLVGLDTSWKTTQDNFLLYPTLPSGNYKLELRAVNKFGIKSELIAIPFSVEQLLGQKPWFRALLLLVFTLIVWRVAAWRIRFIRNKEHEKSDIRRRMGELEQLALKSQMNPHFIFNSLNSIQQYVLDKDIAGSNKFISEFARLIRQTLDISAKKEIPVSEEVTYLSTYLELEKTRLEGKFDYTLLLLGELRPDEVYIPPMMLQPYVENSIRHGVRYRNDKNGKILVSFNKLDGELVCVIEDNGIGRQAALRFKSKNPIEYQSKGMSLIAARVEFLNQNAAQPITIRIEDMEDSQQNATGTRVVMKFPLENGL